MSDKGLVGHRDKDGRPLKVMEWDRLHEDFAYRLVAETDVDGTMVRTMWEGLDDGVRVACMWHTGVCADGVWTRRWKGYYPCTQAEALAAHERVVESVKDPMCACGHVKSGHASIDGRPVRCLNCQCRELRLS